MKSLAALLLVALAGYAFGEEAQPEPFFYPRPYPFYSSSAPSAEDVPQFRLNNNYFLNGFRLPEAAPTSTFQMCASTNNVNRASGVVQLLPGAAPRRCFFVITAPDNSKNIEIHCSRVAVGKSAVLDVVKLSAPDTQVKALTEGAAFNLDYEVYAIKYEDTTNSGSFTCDWRQVTKPPA